MSIALTLSDPVSLQDGTVFAAIKSYSSLDFHIAIIRRPKAWALSSPTITVTSAVTATSLSVDYYN